METRRIVVIINNSVMLSFFDSVDRVRYYNSCVDILLAGEDYKVNEIVIWAKDENAPLSDYIQVKKYDDSFLLIGIYTEDVSLISECMEYVDTIKDAFNEIELRTPFTSVLEQKSISMRFCFATPQYPTSPVYYIKSSDMLSNLTNNDRITIALLSDEDKFEIARDIELGKLDAESMGADAFRACACFNDVKFYLMRVDGEVAGYLRAECGYMNIYDIGWLYVEPRYRGNGYASLLVQSFSRDMFAHGAIPHYGYAISKASARVAEKCGYQCDKSTLICKALKAIE